MIADLPNITVIIPFMLLNINLKAKGYFFKDHSACDLLKRVIQQPSSKIVVIALTSLGKLTHSLFLILFCFLWFKVA